MKNNMTAREYFEIKAIEAGYDHFLHYSDCRDFEKLPDEISKWATEWHENEMNVEEQAPIKSDHRKLFDRIETLERKQDTIWNNIFMAAQYEIVKGGEDKKKILLKGRVDNLENEIKKIWG